MSSRNGPRVSALRETFGLFLSISVLLVAVLACGDPVWSLRGTVIDAAGAPVSGATVNVLCPVRAKPPYSSGKSDAKGEVNLGGIPDLPAGCTVEVVAAGHAPHAFTMTDFCFRSTGTRNAGTPCPAGGTKVVLP